MTGSASGLLKNVPTHCFCAKFEDASIVNFTQKGGVGRVAVADGAACVTKMGGASRRG